jgi:CRISPR-associated protein Cmr5
MSNQRTLEQKRAAIAWTSVQGIKNNPNDEVKKKYGSLAQKAPADIQTNGLGQTLAFWRAKSVAKEKESAEHIAHREILEHVKEWLNNPDSMKLGVNDLVDWVSNTANVNDYRRATTEAIAFLVWLKRFAESDLP